MPCSVQTNTRGFLEKVKILTKVKNWKRKKAKRWVPDLTYLTSSFAAMDVSSQLKQVFHFFDSNGDGKISPLELTKVLLSLGQDKSMATIEAEVILKEVDFNGDGFIDLDEFAIAMELQQDDDDVDLKKAFDFFDFDKNGLISAEELQRVLTRLGCSDSSIGKCRKMIEGVDKDGNGFVDFEEFKSMMTAGNNKV